MVKYRNTSPEALLKGKGAFGDQISSFPIVLQGLGTFSEGWEIAKMVKYKKHTQRHN